jgi:hypothetical protein
MSFDSTSGSIGNTPAANTTSVYTAAGVFPMLPEVLSNDITSLHEGQERLAVVVDMQVEADGTVSASCVYRALVLNRAKLTTAFRPGSTARRPHRRRSPACRDWRRRFACTTLWRARCGSGARRAAR